MLQRQQQEGALQPQVLPFQVPAGGRGRGGGASARGAQQEAAPGGALRRLRSAASTSISEHPAQDGPASVSTTPLQGIMSRVVSASDYSTLYPQSHGIVFNPRLQSTPASKQSIRSTSSSSSSYSVQSSVKSSSIASVPDPTLSPVDIEQILLQKTTAKEDELKKAFQIIDIDQTLKVTKGEFRRVIETFLFPLTQEQFDAVLAKIPGTNSVTVPYTEFFSRFSKSFEGLSAKWNVVGDAQTRTLSQLEMLLREKISKKLKHFVKTCRLFDYNQNGQIQRHELRRILEVNCFKMSDCEYDKLWNRYCISRTNTLNYEEFLQYLGIHLEKKKKRITEIQDLVQNQNESLEKKKSVAKLPVPATAGYNLTKAHLDHTAKEFQKKLCAVYEDIVKACRAYDVGRSGFVSLEYLKSVLNTFVFPVKSDVFQELMNRFGIKISKNMAWERFLDKFHHPMLFDTGQISPSAKHHRTRKLDEALASDRILLKLHGHIQDAYSSLKKAFLMLDRNQDGKITRNELRQILDCIMFRISDEDFQELIKIIDPEHTGHLSYNMFLNLFEDKDSIADSKWINGRKKVVKPSTVLEAWNIAEDVLSEQVKGYWTEFSKALQAFDPRSTGIISRNNFRKVLLLYCPSLTDDHFIALYQKYQDDTTEGVLYRMLLHSLGVADLPKELISYANNPPPQGSQQRGEKRQLDFSERMKQTEDYPYKYKNRIVDEIVEKLRDGILHQEASLRDGFLAYNKQASGKLSKADFRRLLEDFGVPLDDDQFNLLLEKLGFPAGGLSYLDFVAIFEDCRLLGHSSNRKAIASKCRFMTAEECLSQYSEKLAEEYGDPYIAFRKIDLNSDGKVTMLDFRRLLDSLMITMTDEEYARLLGLLGMSMISTLNYPEFLQLYQTQAKKEMRPWLAPSYKPKQIAADADLACEQAHYYLSLRAQTRWHDLAMFFHEYDTEGNGLVLKKDLKNILFRYGIPINPKEFEKLWARYDLNMKGYLTHQEFLQKMGVDKPPDTSLNRPLIAENSMRFMESYKKPERKHIDVNEIINKIRERYHECSQDFHKAFLQQDKHREGYISVGDLRKMLEDFHLPLGYEQYSELLYSLGISIQDNKLSYFDFLRVIDDRAAFRRRRKHTVPPVPPISYMQLGIDEAMIKIKQMVTESSDLLYKAFLAFDKEGTGAISTLDFRQVLHHFCFTLSEKQFNHLLKLQRLRGEHSVDWKNFLQKFNFLSEKEREHLKVACRELSNQEVLVRVQEVVRARFPAIEQEFKKADPSRTKLVSKQDFRDICNRRFLLLTDEQFENLWNTVPLDLHGRLKYPWFLRKFGSEAAEMAATHTVNYPEDLCKSTAPPMAPSAVPPTVPPSAPPPSVPPPSAPPPSAARSAPPTTLPAAPPNTPPTVTPAAPAEPGSRLPSRPQTALSPPPLKKTPAASRPQTAAEQVSPILNCQAIESKVRKIVQHCWKEMLKECRAKDVDRLGEVPTEDFVAIIEKYHLNLTKEEIKQLITKYDYKSVGKFAYSDFLQSCVLLFKHQEPSPTQRVVIQNPRGEKPTGPQSATFFNAMMRIQPQILHCWRPMRRTFKFYDDSGTGLLSIQDFRQVLRKYGINLSEEELFHILEYYDKSLTSKISYNEFLRAFLQ